MLIDYDQQFDKYEQYRDSVPGVPPPLRLAGTALAVREFFSTFDLCVRGLFYKQTVVNVPPWSNDLDDQRDRFYASRLVFLLNSETSINAFADYSTHGDYIITINAGLCAAMEMIFQQLFINKFVFPQIGVREGNLSDSTHESTGPIQYSVADLETFLHSIPRSTETSRAHAANICALLATLFTAYHELAHVLYGHVDYQRKICQRTRLREVGDAHEVQDGRNRDLARVLEYDADSFAIAETARKAMSFEPLVIEYGEDLNAALCTFALTVLFFVFDHERTEVHTALRDLHPHPEVRAYNAFTRVFAESTFSTVGVEWQSPYPHASREMAKDMLREAVRQGIVCNHLLGRRPAPWVLSDDSIGGIDTVFPDVSDIKSQLAQLQSALSLLRPKLRDAKAWATGYR
jgi:hypothetical protein